jgi:hypothetical protein
MDKLCTSKKQSYKHNEQINKQNIDNSECIGVTFVKIYPEKTSQWKKYKIWFWLIIYVFFDIFQYFWQMTVFCLVFILLVVIKHWIKDLLIYLNKMIKQLCLF